MNRVKPQKVALVFALFSGVAHAAWAFVVAQGWAQPFLNYVFKLHMIRSPFAVAAFSWDAAVQLVAVGMGMAFVGGWVLAMIWNKAMK